MTAKEAYKIFNNRCESLIVISCYELASRFVFNAVSKKYADSEDAEKMFGISYFVEKSSGHVGNFNPFLVPKSEYDAAKPVFDFKEPEKIEHSFVSAFLKDYGALQHQDILGMKQESEK